MNIIILDREIIPVEEVRIILTGRDLDLKKDLKLSKDPYQKDWEQRTYVSLKRMYVDEGIIWRAIKGRYDIDRGGRRLLRRHLAIVQQLSLLDKIWNIIK
jgi:hypothetical protein